MYITCPSCSTSYEVDGTQIGHQGRAVRCFNCHHTWQQYPVASPPPRMPRAQPAMAAAPRYSASEPAYGEPAYAEGTYGGGAFPAQAYAAPEPLVHEPAPRPAPERPKAPQPAPPRQQEAVKAAPPPPPPAEPEELPSDQELDKMLGPSRDVAAAKAFGRPIKDETTELDEEAIEALPDPTPLRQIGDSGGDIDLDDDIEPEDIPDPDPIPQVFGGASDDELDGEGKEGGSSLKKLIVPAVSIVAVGVIVAGLILGREIVVSIWPGANEMVYDFIGLRVMVPGDGLKRELIRTGTDTVGNVDFVTATGRVTNISEKAQPVPTLMVEVVNSKVEVLDKKELTLDKAMLQPGESVEFKVTFEGSLARAAAVRTEWGRLVEASAQ